MADDITKAIEELTDRLYNYRVAYILARKLNMPLIEIKGLKDAVVGAKKGISSIRAAAAELNTESSQLETEIKELTGQIKQHRDDLRFEAESLPNDTSGEAAQEEKKPEPPKIGGAKP
jgi:predicted  nucleic acid-binding Zn-ribbon protein